MTGPETIKSAELAPQLPLDQRSLCGMKGCPSRAYYLIAWPLRLPVPFCSKCWAMVRGLSNMSPRQWFEWGKSHFKEHINNV